MALSAAKDTFSVRIAFSIKGCPGGVRFRICSQVNHGIGIGELLGPIVLISGQVCFDGRAVTARVSVEKHKIIVALQFQMIF